MNHVLTWCEIPVTDINRAKAFYSEVLGVSFIDEAMDDMEMAVFDVDMEQVSGALVKSNHYVPRADGTVVYLNGGQDLTPALERIERLGATVIWPKTPIKDGSAGYFAQFMDSEGNRVGLYSVA